MTEKHYDLMIARPVYGDFPRQAEIDFINLWHHTEAAGYTVIYKPVSNTLLEDARNMIVEQRNLADWILWMDVDMIAPPDTAVRLMRHNQPIMGTIAFAKAIPSLPCSFIYDEHEACKPLYGWPDESIIEVDATGFGVILTASWVFDHLPKRPFIRNLRNPAGEYMGEDYAFCYRAQEAGFAILVDTGIEVGQIGEYTYGAKDYLPHRDKVGTVDGKRYFPKMALQVKSA